MSAWRIVGSGRARSSLMCSLGSGRKLHASAAPLSIGNTHSSTVPRVTRPRASGHSAPIARCRPLAQPELRSAPGKFACREEARFCTDAPTCGRCRWRGFEMRLRGWEPLLAAAPRRSPTGAYDGRAGTSVHQPPSQASHVIRDTVDQHRPPASCARRHIRPSGGRRAPALRGTRRGHRRWTGRPGPHGTGPASRRRGAAPRRAGSAGRRGSC